MGRDGTGRDGSGFFQMTTGLYQHWYSTEAIEIQGEKPKKSGHPPTAQTPGPNWLIFWRETPHVNTFGRTGAIFEFHPRSGDM